MRVCAEGGCPEQIERGSYCPAHEPRRTEARRSPSSRVTGTWRWREKVKPRVLQRDRRRCHYCGGRATTVDHRIPVAERPDLAFDESNLVASCEPCNLTKGDR